jgi:probable HAF family extracellular repeat protein
MNFLMSLFSNLIYGFGTIIVATAALSYPQSVQGQTTGYILTDLSADDASQVPCRMNNLGALVGRASGGTSTAQMQATVWNRSTHAKKHLGVLAGGDYSSATGINDNGEVTGVSNTSPGIVPFLWTARGGLKRVPLLPGDNCGQATSINRHGHVVGYSSGESGAKAFFWGRNGSIQRLTSLPGGDSGKARDLNDRDEIVGTSGSSTGQRAVLWTKNGSVRDLGTLPGDYASEAIGINNNGEVVGYSKGPTGMRAFLWNEMAGMQYLGVLPGRDSSRALAINDLGQVVGSSSGASGDHAFVWTRQDGMVDLNDASSADLGVVLFEAHAINDKGQILVMGESNREMTIDPVSGVSVHEDCAPAPSGTFLLTPTPAK